MARIQTLPEIRQIFKNVIIAQFLDDAYHLSGSERTRETYRQVLYSFNRFCNISYDKNLLEVIDSIKSKSLEEVLDLFLNYKRYLDNHITRTSLPVANGSKRIHLSTLKNFCRAQGIRIHHEDVRDHVKIGRRMRVQKFPLDVQTIARIIENLEQFHYKALTILLASTGMRVMEALTLQPSDFDFESNPVSIKIRAGETKTNEGRSVYLTKECTTMIEQLLVNKPPSQISLFGKPTDPIKIYHNYSSTLRNVFLKIGLSKRLDNGINQVTIHSFRSFFRTCAGHLISRDFAESFIGHRFYLSEYQNMPEEEKKKLFLKLEPHITFRQTKIRKISNPEIFALQEQVADLQNKIMMLGQKFLVVENFT